MQVRKCTGVGKRGRRVEGSEEKEGRGRKGRGEEVEGERVTASNKLIIAGKYMYMYSSVPFVYFHKIMLQCTCMC